MINECWVQLLTINWLVTIDEQQLKAKLVVKGK